MHRRKHPYQISIPEPCHEDWNKMTPTLQGRYCGSCEKNLIDFTLSSDKALIEYLEYNEGNICGKFHYSQLDRAILTPQMKQSNLLSRATTVLTLLGSSAISFAQEDTVKVFKPTYEVPIIDEDQGKGIIGKVDIQAIDSVQITGTVLDSDFEAIPFAKVLVEGISQIWTMTNFDGKFQLDIRNVRSRNIRIQVSAHEFQLKTMSLVIEDSNKIDLGIIKIDSSPIETMMGAVVIIERTNSIKGRRIKRREKRRLRKTKNTND